MISIILLHKAGKLGRSDVKEQGPYITNTYEENGISEGSVWHASIRKENDISSFV